MDDDSIAGRTQKLRRDMELLLKAEWHYRGQRSHSLTENAEHEERRGQLMIIREELRTLVEEADRRSSHGSVWYS